MLFCFLLEKVNLCARKRNSFHPGLVQIPYQDLLNKPNSCDSFAKGKIITISCLLCTLLLCCALLPPCCAQLLCSAALSFCSAPLRSPACCAHPLCSVPRLRSSALLLCSAVHPLCSAALILLCSSAFAHLLCSAACDARGVVSPWLSTQNLHKRVKTHKPQHTQHNNNNTHVCTRTHTAHHTHTHT